MSKDRRSGLQLYTVRTLMEDDVASTLQKVADVGYEEVEFAGYFGHSPTEIKDMLGNAGLRAPSCHGRFNTFRTSIDEVIDAAETIGNRFVVCAFIPPEEREEIDNFRKIADEFNRWGSVCAEAGLQFAFHNHDFEFAEMDGEIPFDIILDRCDPGFVKIEIDLYWVRKGGFEPAPFFEKYPDRFPLVHVKDMDESGGMTEVGAGTIDFESDLSHAERAGMRHYFVEHDEPGDAVASIETSFAGIRRLLA